MTNFAQQFVKTDEGLEAFEHVVTTYLIESNTPFSLMVYLRLKHNGWEDLLSIEADPYHSLTDFDFANKQQILALFSKAPFLPLERDTRKAAMEKFIEAEVACYETNERFSNILEGVNPVMASILHNAKRKISKILGDCPKSSELSFKFGPGASFSVGGNNTTSYRKLGEIPETTYQAQKHAVELLGSCPSYSSLHSVEAEGDTMQIVQGSRLSFVKKNAKTDRPICIEPLLNAVMQKGIGLLISKALKKAGNDIKTGQQRNARLARLGSVTGHLATIDLKSASDMIAWAFVFFMMPKDWFDLADDVRSHYYTIEDNWYQFQKFSSMGNGFTFELETLLFLTLARATCEELGEPVDQVAVYGDDIIIPTKAAELLCEVLGFCGFQVNHDKSFLHGPFRESCGFDAFLGKDVRPMYIRNELSPFTWYLALNAWTRKGFNEVWPKTRKAMYKALPSQFRKFHGPDDGTDGHIVLSSAELMRINRWLTPYRSFKFSPKKIKVASNDEHYHVNALYEIQGRNDGVKLEVPIFHSHFDPKKRSKTLHKEKMWVREDSKVTSITKKVMPTVGPPEKGFRPVWTYTIDVNEGVPVLDEFGNFNLRGMYFVKSTKQMWDPVKISL